MSDLAAFFLALGLAGCGYSVGAGLSELGEHISGAISEWNGTLRLDVIIDEQDEEPLQ